jgi:transposase InsO family protein
MKYDLPQYPFERCHADLTQFQFSTSGFRYVLVVKDALTKWVEMFPLRDKLAVTIADALVDQVFLRFGPPRTLITDRGTEFDNHLLKEVCDLLGARHIRCTPQNPRSDGLAENQMRTFKDALSQLVNKHHDDWDEFIPMLAMHYRTTVNDATAYTPFYLVFGREAIAPDFGDILATQQGVLVTKEAYIT